MVRASPQEQGSQFTVLETSSRHRLPIGGLFWLLPSSHFTIDTLMIVYGTPLQYSCLENPMDGGAWCRLQSMGSLRVGHN